MQEIVLGRNRVLDIMKGIGIIWIIIYHKFGGLTFAKYLTSFFIPLFFIISGYCYDEEKNEEFVPLLCKKARRLLVPYVCFTILPAVLLGAAGLLAQGEIAGPYIASFLYLNGHVLYNGPCWFLGAMFTTTLLFWGIVKVVRDRKKMPTVLLIFSVVGYSLSLIFNSKAVTDLRLPFGMDIALNAVVFFGAGWILREKTLGYRREMLGVYCLLVIPIHVFVSIYCNDFVNMSCNYYGNYLAFYVCAVLGIFSTWVEALYLQRCFLGKVIEYLGKNSIILMCMHMPLFKIISTMCAKLFARTHNWYLNSFIMLILTFALSVPVIEIINRKLPFLVGIPARGGGKN